VKKNLLKRVEKDLKRIDRRCIISMSNSSDPYPPMEIELRLTRSCLEIFKREEVRIQVITKSDLVVRDIDILREMPSVVSFTLTTLRKNLAEELEPCAPSPSRRLNAMKALAEAGVPVALRLDPIFPWLNDGEIERIIRAAVDAGAKHVTSSTFKPRPDGWRRFSQAFPEIARRLAPLYFEKGERHHNSWYLPLDLRITLMKRVKATCEGLGVSFASCREGLKEITTAPSCDGTHLLPKP
jgi:DNA repair photolyase